MRTPTTAADPLRTTRQTRQRDALRHIVAEAPGPLSIAELLEAAQNRLESIGVATVYRTVRLMEEAGELRPVVLPGGETRWESSDRGHHHHFQCRVCSRVTDFHGCPLHVHAGSLPAGFVVESHEVHIVGHMPFLCHPFPAHQADSIPKPGIQPSPRPADT